MPLTTTLRHSSKTKTCKCKPSKKKPNIGRKRDTLPLKMMTLACSKSSKSTTMKHLLTLRRLEPRPKQLVPSLKSREPLRRPENVMRQSRQNLQISNSDQARERLNTMVLLQLSKLLRLNSKPTRQLSQLSHNNSLTVQMTQLLDHGKLIWTLLRLPPKA